MAVVEYMLHNIDGDHRRQVPGFIGDRGHWYNPTDHTYIGWVSDNRDFYVPDSVITLDMDSFVNRMLAMHQASPMRKPDPEAPGPMGMMNGIDMTTEEVRSMAENWYANFVTENANK